MRVPVHNWQGISPPAGGGNGAAVRRGHTRGGGTNWFPLLLRITTPSFRTRCARKGKCRFLAAAQLRGQGKRNCCHTISGRALRAPTERDAAALPWGDNFPSCCFQKMGGGNLDVTHLARGARPKRKGVDWQEGENRRCSPSCPQCGRAGRENTVMSNRA